MTGYPMETLEQARASLLKAGEDLRSGLIDEGAFADVRAMLHDRIRGLEPRRRIFNPVNRT